MPISTPEVIDFPGFPTVVVRYRDWPMSDMPAAMDRAFRALGRAIGEGSFQPTGPAFARYEQAPGETADFETGFPVDSPLAENIVVDGVHVITSELPACRLAITKHTGAYDGLGQAWGAFMSAIAEQGLTPGLPFWEAYDTEPTPEMDPAELITGLAVPVTQA